MRAVAHALSLALTGAVWLLSTPALAADPQAADDHPLDAQLACRERPHQFVGALLDEGLLKKKPMRVERDSVNAFRPVAPNTLKAFGFAVYVVIGYEPNDAMFAQGSGKTIDHPVYGVVVSGPRDAVEQRVREAGSGATVQTVIPLMLTAVVCDAP